MTTCSLYVDLQLFTRSPTAALSGQRGQSTLTTSVEDETMNLLTLLDAARYLEYKSEAGARGEEIQDFTTFTQLASSECAPTPSAPTTAPLPSSSPSSIIVNTAFSVATQNSNSNSSHDSPPPPQIVSSPGSIGVGVIQQTGSYRQRSSSVASRNRTDSLSSHDENSRDQKQSRRSGGAGTREVHNKLEKNRRAHLKECFESLKQQLPKLQDDRKTSNLTILRSALRYIQTLKKRQEECELKMEQLAREKISAQQRLATLRRDGTSVLPLGPDVISVHTMDARRHLFASEKLAAEKLVSEQHKRRGSVSPDNETTTTASECGNQSDLDDNDFDHLSSSMPMQLQNNHNGQMAQRKLAAGSQKISVAHQMPSSKIVSSGATIELAKPNAHAAALQLQQLQDERKPITISVNTSVSNPIYQQATKSQTSVVKNALFAKTLQDNHTKDDSFDVRANSPKSDKKQIIQTDRLNGLNGQINRSMAGGSPITFLKTEPRETPKIELAPTSTILPTQTTQEPPRAIFTPGNQKTVLPTFLPNTGHLATLLNATPGNNTVSYIKAPHTNGDCGVSVSTTGTGTLTSIPLMCKTGSVVRLAPNTHIVQPLTLITHQQTNTTPTLFLTQTSTGQMSGQFKAANAVQATSVATVITQTPLTTVTAENGNGTMVVPQNVTVTNSLNHMGKVQIGGNATLSIKPVSQYISQPLLPPPFMTPTPQSLKPVVVVSVPQTSAP